jgi:hypothetical protein
MSGQVMSGQVMSGQVMSGQVMSGQQRRPFRGRERRATYSISRWMDGWIDR